MGLFSPSLRRMPCYFQQDNYNGNNFSWTFCLSRQKDLLQGLMTRCLQVRSGYSSQCLLPFLSVLPNILLLVYFSISNSILKTAMMLGLCQFYINLINAKPELIFCSVVMSWIWLDSFPDFQRDYRGNGV